jgi:hypothetical protein
MSEMSRLARFSGTLLLIVGGRAALGSPPQTASPSRATRSQITILYDAFGKPGPMRKSRRLVASIVQRLTVSNRAADEARSSTADAISRCTPTISTPAPKQRFYT